MRKLVRALPEPLRKGAARASAAVMVDPAGWDRSAPTRVRPVHLDALQRAVVDGVQLVLGYVARDRSPTRRLVHPLGLVAKGRQWYLVAGTDAGLRSFRVDRVTTVEPTGQPVVEPEGFDLAATWRLITDDVERRRTPLVATARAVPAALGPLHWVLGTRVEVGDTGADERVAVVLRGHSIASLAAEVAGFGAWLDIVDPPELRSALAAIGRQLVDAYGGEGG